MRHTQRIMVILLTLFTLLVGSITILKANVKIIDTASELIALNDNIRFYNEQARKTDEMTEDYMRYDAARKELYNSEDTVVHMYSNSHALIKIFLLILALLSFVIVPYVFLYNLVHMVRRLKKYRRKINH